MEYKLSKADRKEDRIQRLERELAAEKKKSRELQQQKTVRLDNEQINSFYDKLIELCEWHTNCISDDIRDKRLIISLQSGTNGRWDTFSKFLRWVLSALFMGFGTCLVIGLICQWQQYWTESIEKISVIVTGIIGLLCFLVGIDIHNEKDRNYMISMFSALVALTALIVALVK